MTGIILRVMGESDIYQFALNRADPPKAADALADSRDRLNRAGHLLDAEQMQNWQAADEALVERAAAELLADTSLPDNSLTLILLLREKWPVGSKARNRLTAERAGADWTYLEIICAPVPLSGLDEEAIAEAERLALSSQIAGLRRTRKRFAASSALHGFLQQVS